MKVYDIVIDFFVHCDTILAEYDFYSLDQRNEKGIRYFELSRGADGR